MAAVVLDPNDECHEIDDEDNDSLTSKPSQKLNKKGVTKALNLIKDVLRGHTFNGYDWSFPVVEPDKTTVNIDGEDKTGVPVYIIFQNVPL